MNSIKDALNCDVNLSRRRFVTGLGMIGALATFGMGSSALASIMRQQSSDILTGTNFKLKIGKQSVNFTGVTRTATTINNSLPAPNITV